MDIIPKTPSRPGRDMLRVAGANGQGGVCNAYDMQINGCWSEAARGSLVPALADVVILFATGQV